MKLFVRIMTLALAILMLAGMAVACAQPGDDVTADTTTAANQTVDTPAPGENNETPEDTTTQSPADDTTEAPADDTTTAETPDVTTVPNTADDDKGGCGSFNVWGALLALISLAGVVIFKKK